MMLPDNDYNHDSQRLTVRKTVRRGHLIVFMLCFAVLSGTTILSPAWSATPAAPLEEPGDIILVPDNQLQDMIRRLQRALISLEFYDGPVTGSVTPETDKAIRTYQRQNGMRSTGIVTPDLVSRIEMAVNIGTLLDKLSTARQADTDAARAALLNHPSTRDLIEGELDDEAADATRDPSLCFAEPTVRCLLAEALENAKAVNRSEMRNWAYGEILIAQARVGLTASARDTTRRINDPRLIIAALGEIAQAQALSGNHDNALAAVATIPIANERASAYANIAEIMSRLGNQEGALFAVARLEEETDQPETDLKQVAYLARASVILARNNQQEHSSALLERLEQKIRDTANSEKRDSILRHIANAEADRGNLAKALELLEDVSSDSEKIPVLMRTAEALALAGDTSAAMATAQSIAALRYRAVILSTIGIEQARTGQKAQALETLTLAIQAKEGIRFPFARDYASSRIALAYGEISLNGDTPAPELFIEALSSVEDIQDQQLRAKTYWMLAFARQKSGDGQAQESWDDAIAATIKIESTTSQAWMLADLAENRAKAGQLDWASRLYERALGIAKTISSSWGKARALAKISQALMALAEIIPHAPPERTGEALQ